MKRLVIFFVFAIILASLPAAAFKEIGWRDLTVPIDPEDDPYFGQRVGFAYPIYNFGM